MQHAVRSLVFAAAAFVATTTATPSFAVVLNPADFSIIESPGQYTVYNNSSDWYIYAFAVSNPAAVAAFGASASTNYKNWQALVVSLNLNSPFPVAAFAYASNDANVSDLNNVTLPTVTLSNYIGPGQFSSDFHFVPAVGFSDFGMLLVNLDERTFDSVNGVASETPLPAALPLFAGGLGALGLLGWRRKRMRKAAA